MKTIEVSVSIGLIGCTRTTEFEVDDDIPEEQIETYAMECMYEMVDWNWKVKK